MDLQALLKEKWFRTTKEREKIFSYMQTKHLFTASDIEKQFSNIGRASIFRTIKFFFELGIVRKISLGNNTTYYEINDKNNPHEHMKCQKCDEILSFDSSAIYSEIFKKAKKEGFQIQSHSVNILWICDNCK